MMSSKNATGVPHAYRVGLLRTNGWLCFAVMLLMSAPGAAQSPDKIYEIGTDVGMEYLSEFSGRLRVTLILEECNFKEVAAEIGRGLPNSVDFFLDRRNGLDWPTNAILSAAQVTRAYLLGYEVGVRTEFQREPLAENKRFICSVVAAAAGQMLP